MRSSRNGTARAAAAAFAAAALIGLSAAPAYAEGESGAPTPSPAAPSQAPKSEAQTGADLSVAVASGESTQDSWSKYVRVTVKNDGPETAKDVVVTVTVEDFTDQDNQIQPVDKRCTGKKVKDDLVFTCALGDLRSGGTNNDVLFDFWHGEAAPGSVAEGQVSVTSATTDPAKKNNTAPFTLSVIEAGVDVSIWAAGEVTVKPGETTSLSGRDFLRIDNESDTEVEGLSFSLSLPAYAKFEPDYSFCSYSEDGRKMNCELPDYVLEPGSGLGRLVPFTAQAPLRITVAADAPGPISLGRGTATVTPGVLRDLGVNGKKKAATSREKAAPGKGDDSVEFSLVTTDNPVDMSIKATGASGRVGATVSVDVTIRNEGKVIAPGVTITFTAPSGTTIVGGPTDCAEKTKGKVWVCASKAWAAPGAVGAGTFKLRLDTRDVKDGTATVESAVKDSKPADNTAKVTVTATGGLPVTGTSLTIAGIAAAALLVAGAALIVVTRRKRATAGAPAETPAAPAADETDGSATEDEGEAEEGDEKK
ncbi:hypothetical protein Afil01_55200 [Actinorhabdospora filicis]|uniref:DUF11 domain-containing protein n=1 Tax=Actinorhabdospora filicis TaxID=1785913 RepID=A0A9W6SRF2_9ACTN|nr:LPXTG cell wall anchor domain-containing protein [Actinorhabdospora filicis]GLZ80713.1 hypothetical protein Afil01_55200 [Actinorhabdospora filicis]